MTRLRPTPYPRARAALGVSALTALILVYILVVLPHFYPAITGELEPVTRWAVWGIIAAALFAILSVFYS